MSEQDYQTILASLLFARDAGALTELEYASAYNAFNRAVDFEYENNEGFLP